MRELSTSRVDAAEENKQLHKRPVNDHFLKRYIYVGFIKTFYDYHLGKKKLL